MLRCKYGREHEAIELPADQTICCRDKMLVDAMTCRMVLQPNSLDTIVATNLHADILSDLAAALAGSIGIAPTSNLDPTRQVCPFLPGSFPAC